MKTKFTILTFILCFTMNAFTQKYYRQYKAETALALSTQKVTDEIMKIEDLGHLPQPVRKYLIYVGVVGKPRVSNFHVEFEGGIRQSEKQGWMKFKSMQNNFIDAPTRIFYIHARKMGLPAYGLHLYKEQTAMMQIKVAGLFQVVDAKGFEMNQGETVTVFNDMCFMAPATLINKNIQWKTIDSLTVDAKFTNGNITIGARLFFNEKGELINFISNDRFETTDGKIYKNYPWITPVSEYKEINGYRLASQADAIYRRPDGDFCYGRFTLMNVEYNRTNIK